MCNGQYIQITPQILVQAMQGELNGISRYKQLYEMATDAQDADAIRTIHNDEVNHYKALANLYQQLTGAAPPALEGEPPPPLSSFGEGVKEAVPEELADSEFYRCIALGCDNPSRQMFFDIMSDENKHAAWFNYLYIKSLERCCGEEPGPEPVLCDGIAHTVQAGDSLWSIGRQYAVAVEELLAANPQITDPANIYVGQILCIPCSGISYTMQPGDSLWQIAQRNGMTVEDLVAANPILTDPSNIATGQIICIPIGEPEPPAPPTPGNPQLSLTYLYGGTSAYYQDLLAAIGNSVNTVSPDFFELDESGNLLLAASEKLNPRFVESLHQQGIAITPFLSNHWNRERGVAALGNREQLSAQLADAVAQYGLDGVNIDLENITQDYRSAYVDLVRLLREKLPGDKTVSVAVAANPNGWNTGWHGSYDYKGLADTSDYLVIMAYDESYEGGPEGPVSSASFFERSIQYALAQGVPEEKIVAGLPFYGRYWKQGESVGGLGIADRDVESLLDNYESSSYYDEAAQSALAVITIRPGEAEPQIWGGRKLTAGTYRIWYDSPEATRHKLEIVARYGLRGAGAWALGQENPSIWDFYTQALNG